MPAARALVGPLALRMFRRPASEAIKPVHYQATVKETLSKITPPSQVNTHVPLSMRMYRHPNSNE